MRSRERPSAKVRSRTQCSWFPICQWPRIQPASRTRSARNVVNEVVGSTVTVVHLPPVGERLRRASLIAWAACGTTFPLRSGRRSRLAGSSILTGQPEVLVRAARLNSEPRRVQWKLWGAPGELISEPIPLGVSQRG